MYFTALLAASIYAIIGGPSAGKTSIINHLKNEGYTTIEEAATRHIKECFEQGQKEPWEFTGFQQSIFQLQQDLEKEALAKNSSDIIFVDRGFLDNLVYLEHNGRKETSEYTQIEHKVHALNISKYYKAVFYIEPHSSLSFELEKSDVRRESTEESLELARAIKNAYAKHYDLISIPGDLSIKQRAALIIEKVNQIHPPKKSAPLSI